MQRSKPILSAISLLLAGAITLSGCSSSDDNGSDSGSGASAASGGAGAAAGSDAKADILVIGDFTSTIPFTLPEIVPMVKGVLKNFPNVKVDSCDGKGTPAGFLACEQQAVQNSVDAVVLGFAAGAQDQSVLDKAKIPVIGNTKGTADTIYPTAESFSLYVALGAGLAESGCKKLGIVYLDGSDFLVDYIKQGFEGKGGKEVARGAVAANAADLSPAVSKVTSASPDCVAVSLTPAGAAQALTALKQTGKTFSIGSISAIFSQQLIDSLGALTDGVIVVDSALNSNDDAPGINAAKAAMQGEDSKAKMTQQAVGAFIGSTLLAAGLTKAGGDVTTDSLNTALNGLRDVDMQGVIPNWSSEPIKSTQFARIFNHYGINYKLTGGKAVKQGDFYDTSALLAD
jgi:ABC-type branched-subunit amino acid transport system substrate-binding protein